MADSKITALTAISTVDPTADPLVIVDVSDTSMAASGTTKKSTINQLLGAGGTATLASATITGDLTVATDALKVNSSTKDICIGTTTPTFNNKLTVVGGAGGDAFITSGNGTRTGYIGTDGTNVIMGAYSNHPLRIHVNDYPQMEVAALGVFNWYDGAGGTRMTLNANGLGIGVTPSAWFSTWKVLQLAGGSFGGPSDRSFLLQNAIVNPGGNFQYVSGSSTPASGYRQFNGAHDWYTAAAGTSPNTITDFSSPKMTLDESGNLILLSSNTPATLTTNGQLTVNATSNTNLRFSYRGSDGVTRTANITLA